MYIDVTNLNDVNCRNVNQKSNLKSKKIYELN